MRRFKEARRYSNIEVCEKVAPPVPSRRRASELPASTAAGKSSGIVCTNTDLLSIMNTLKSTAVQQQQQSTATTAAGGRPGSSKTTDSLPAVTAVDRRRDVLRTNRSNSVDVANLGATAAMAATAAGNSTRNWFRKISTRASASASATASAVVSTVGLRGGEVECPEQPRPAAAVAAVGGEYAVVQKSPVVVTFTDERPKVSLLEPTACKPADRPLPPPPPPPSAPSVANKQDDVVVWDRPTGSVVNAEVLGTAIEGILAAKKSGDSGDVTPADGGGSDHQPPGKIVSKPTNEPNNRTCDTSICSSLKDLFVK